jgi:nucleoid DNA-binding protein
MALHFEKVQAKIGFGKDKEVKYVGKRRLADPFTIERLAKEISHETMIKQATCEIVLKYMVEAIEDALQDGRSVDIGIGTISPAISTVAADTADKVTIRKKRVLFRASKRLRTIVENMSVRLITDEDDGTTDTLPDDSSDAPSPAPSPSPTPVTPTDDSEDSGIE